MDTQVTNQNEVRHMSARYMLTGKDKEGADCRIYVENNACARAYGAQLFRREDLGDAQTFADAGDISAYALPAVSWARSAKSSTAWGITALNPKTAPPAPKLPRF